MTESDLVIIPDHTHPPFSPRNWIEHTFLDVNYCRKEGVLNGVIDHAIEHGTYPRGYLHLEDRVSKKLRDSHRTKNKFSRIARRITRLRDLTQH